MRICAVTTSFTGFGGIQNVIARTVEYLPHHQWEIRAVHLDVDGVRRAYPRLGDVLMTEALSRRLPRRLPDRLSTTELRRLLEAAHLRTQRIDADVIVAHYPLSTVMSLSHSNVVWYAHCPLRFLYEPWLVAESGRPSMPTRWLRDRLRKIERLAAARMAAICCNSERTKGKLREFLGVESEVVYMGCDLERARCEAYEPYFVYPTRLQRYKRVDLAIEAIARVPGARLKIIGTGYEGPRLRALAAGFRNIEIVDRVDDIYDEYARCLGVIYTPYDEDFGLVPVEAMSCGKPVIAVNEGGPRETVVDGQTGFLVEPTPEAIAQKASLLVENPEFARELGARGRERAARFSWDHFATAFERVLEEAATTRRAGGTEL